MKRKSKRKKRTVRLTALLLAAALLASTQSITSLAATVSENAMAVEENSTDVMEPDSQEKETVIDTKSSSADVQDKQNTEEDEVVEDGLAEDRLMENQAGEDVDSPVMAGSAGEDDGSPVMGGSSSEEVKKAGSVPEGTPENPVHNCNTEDATQDTTTWGYVYFGSYPQSEVTDIATISAIDAKIAEVTAEGYDYPGEKADIGTDVWVNGTKYRRISKSDTNYDKYFGNSDYRYFKWERIRWRVLWNSGTELFVMADTALDCKCYHDEWIGITWKSSPLRSWLNGSFYDTAFNSKEQNAIVEQTIVNEDNPVYNTIGGSDTKDKIYLLSISEVSNPAYGFCSNGNVSSASRKLQTSEYANARGTLRSTDSGYEGNCSCWLRSPGYTGDCIAEVAYNGRIDMTGNIVCLSNNGIVPALHINLSSDIWCMEDDGTSGEGGEERILTSLKATKTKTTYTQGETLNLDDLTVEAGYSLHKTMILQKKAYTTNAATIDMNTPGEKTLIVSCTENGVTKTADIALTVNKNNVKVRKLTINAPSKKLAAGKKVKLTVTVAPANAANQAVTWKTSNKKYATIDKNGKLTLKKAGAGKNVTITATAKDGSGKKATIKITIMKDAVKSIKLKAPSKTLKAGKTMTIKTTIKTTGKKANKTLKWTSSNKNYATVNNKGKVTAKKAGKGKTVTITAQATDGSGKKAKVKIKMK